MNHLYINNSKDYVLLLASGEYDKIIAQNKTLNSSPYKISGHGKDYYYDYTRQRFLCDFLNTYYSFVNKKELQDDEYRINIEFLIYTHIWEAKSLLKKLYRLANLLCGNEYDWKITISQFRKSDFINNKIINPFNIANCLLGKIIKDNYKTELRNAIAHSDYQIDIHNRRIRYKSKSGLNNTSFDDWSIHFAYSFCLSYYFLNIINERRRRIIQDIGKNCFTIKMPFSDGTRKHVLIQYEADKDEFGYIYKTEDFQIKTQIIPSQGVFFDGQVFDAYN